MQISNLSITPIQRQLPRQDSSERELGNTVSDEESVIDASQADFGGQANANSEQITQRPVESSSQSSNVFSRSLAESEADDLSFNSRRALQIFSENTPSAQQQLGVELVGVDTFA